MPGPQVHGLGDLQAQLFADAEGQRGGSGLGGGQARQQDDELVASHAGHGVALAHMGDQALGHLADHGVTGHMAEVVVDAL